MNTELSEAIKVLENTNTTQQMVADARESFLVSLNGNNVPSLNYLRYVCHIQFSFRYNAMVFNSYKNYLNLNLIWRLWQRAIAYNFAKNICSLVLSIKY